MKKIITLLSLLIISNFSYMQNNSKFSQFVNPFIGTEGEGNVFPGVSLPFGMVKLGPDCADLTSNSGYNSNGNIKGFSHTHVSGTGGGPKYGNVLVSPIVGEISLQDYGSLRENEKAEVGFYQVDLVKHNVQVELTSSHSVGFHKYRFPKSDQSKILIDLGSFLTVSWCDGCSEEQKLVGAEIEIVNDTLIEGYTRVRHGWNIGDAYTVYFSASFNKPAKSFGTWKEDEKNQDNNYEYDSGESVGAWFEYDTEEGEEIEIKVGISFLGRMKAKESIQKEIPHWNFEQVRESSVREWEKYFQKIIVETENEELKTIFYTALYHSLLQPSNRSGENPGWSSDTPYYDDFYAIWDTFRATHPLLTIISPAKQTEIVNALINIYSHEGFMPDARSGNSTGRTQGGSNCDVLISDAFMKGLKGIDYEKALESMIKNAEIDPGPEHQMKGRGGLLDYNSLGYISTEHERAGSRTVEYAYNDYCIYLVAKGLGKDSIADKYLRKSENWKNLWKPVEDNGVEGFIMPKNKNGEWDEEFMGRNWSQEDGWYPVDFTVHTHGTWEDFFYEADSWEYSFYVPHNVEGLIKLCGGIESFDSRLDTFFSKGYFSVSNEPSFLTPAYYNYIGRQDKTSSVIRNIIKSGYTTARNGIPGNDDSGSMSSWVAFNLMGFYPNAGQDLYLITTPHFEKVTINHPSGEEFIITAHELSKENVFIQKIILNGKSLNRSWLKHNEISGAGKIEFIMGKNPNNNWDKLRPPSKVDN